MKESLFAILAPRLLGARVADLFAGSGALGLEALSRGAKGVVFVERDAAALGTLAQNAAHARLEPFEVKAGDVFGLLEDLARSGPFDVVLADPPYRKGIGTRLLEQAPWERVLAVDGVFALEHEAGLQAENEALETFDHRRYGRSALSFYRRRDS